MHGVRGAEFVVHYQADGGVVAEVVDVPLRVVGVGCIALVCEKEDRVLVVCAESLAIHGEEIVAG